MPNDTRHHFGDPKHASGVLGLSDADYQIAKAAVIRAATLAAMGAGTHPPVEAPVEAPQTGASTGSTASTARAPAPVMHGSRDARSMSDAEWIAARAEMIRGGR
jgi:hypothetical protein